ncbi:ParB/RepB/Spo0J family partition protein [Streptomyces sp. NPDC007100]|uniref:ParB/RepB/Spo0J family partition protein n=1 Tax=unclassified Streptomyces TaxID=2593676 RepID=UPI0033FA7FD2
MLRSSMRVIDGMHRLRAAESRGATEIDVQFFDGEERDAFVLAVEANIAHGLPLSLTDRRAAAARIITTHPQWSDRSIGAATGLSPKTVGAVRARSTEGVPQSNVRIGRDGRARPLDSTEGRRVADRLMRENPDAPLRRIAEQAGVSLGTVFDVRKRRSRGEEPVPQRGRAEPETAGAPAAQPPRRPAERTENRVPRDLKLRQLSRDPSLRLTEDGRALLRWLTVVAVRSQEWERLLGSVPPHCVGVTAELARGCAETWQQVAEALERAGVEAAAGPAALPAAGARLTRVHVPGRAGRPADIG